MKRSEMIEKISNIIPALGEMGTQDSLDIAEDMLSVAEKAGMLPPVQSPTLVEDTYNGGTKHGPAQRVWDKE